MGSIQGSGGGSIEDRLRGRPGTSLRVSLRASLGIRVGGSFVSLLLISFNEEKLFSIITTEVRLLKSSYRLLYCSSRQ